MEKKYVKVSTCSKNVKKWKIWPKINEDLSYVARTQKKSCSGAEAVEAACFRVAEHWQNWAKEESIRRFGLEKKISTIILHLGYVV